MSTTTTMAFRIERFPDTAEACAASVRFNERLEAGGHTDFQLMTSPFCKHSPEGRGLAQWQQYFLAWEETAGVPLEARGGYIMQYQEVQREGRAEAAPCGFLRLPLSEGIVDPRYSAVGMLLVRDAMKRQPELNSLGMGGVHRPLPRLMQGLGWHVVEVPFHFHVLRPFNFFRNARVLRRKRFMTPACEIAAWTGLGGLALGFKQRNRPSSTHVDPGIEVILEPTFGPWADEIWERCHPHYSFCGKRTTPLLHQLYPPDDPRWIILHLRRGGKSIGWALLLCTDVRVHKQFGNMRLGSLADCISTPEDAPLVVRAAMAELRRRKADLIVTNQVNAAWNTALKQNGFIGGPSNFVWAIAPGLKKQFASVEDAVPRAHINRGDGDGPINL